MSDLFDPDKIIPWLILNECRGINFKCLTLLLEHFKTAQALVAASEKDLKLLGVSDSVIHQLKHPDSAKIKNECAFATRAHQYIIPLDHPQYPKLLREIASPPFVLYVKGNLNALQEPQLAVVGSRNPTPNGIETAIEFSYALANAGLNITSGLALGVDGAAHQGALRAKKATIAVLGSGLECIYPLRHKPLANNIIENHGALVSEFSLQAPPNDFHFPQRNRIISGLSLGTLVVEATVRSGSLITAHYAVEQGREVFAVPGSIHNPQSRGCHKLIREGAKIIETIEDILIELNHFVTPLQTALDLDIAQTPLQPLDKTCQKLLECAGYEVVTVDQLVMRSGLSASTVTSNLLTLELIGAIKLVTGGYLRVKNET